MKIKSLCFFIAITSICALTPAFADGNASDERQGRDVAQPHFFFRGPQPILPAKASQILGHEILDKDGDKIGKVRELAFDLHNGHIAEVIVGTGGFLGMREKVTAVPPTEFSWDPEAKKLICRLDPEQLRNAPIFDLAHWPDSVTADKVRATYRRYGVTTYFIDDTVARPVPTEVKPAEQLTSGGMAAPTVHLGPLTRARDIIGESVDNPQAEHVGKVENAIVDLGAGHIVVLIVSTGDFLRMGNEVSALPPQVFHQGADQKSLRVDATREQLRTIPHLKPEEWQSFADPDHVATIYNAYSLPPYQYMIASADTAQNVRDRYGNVPIIQGTSASDQAITAHIRHEIMSRRDLSADAQNVRIITVNGQVTVRGPVRTQQEEQAIIEIARNAVAENAKVTNRIQTIDEPPRTIEAPTTGNSN